MGPRIPLLRASLAFVFACAPGLGVLAGGAPAVAGTAPGPPSCTVGWGDPSTSDTRSALTGIVRAGTNAWAVGIATPPSDVGDRHPIARRWDGSAWQAMPVHPYPGELGLFAIDRSPRGQLWSVGYRAYGSVYYPTLMRWNGSEWRRAHVSHLDGRPGGLLAVRALGNTDIWSVGYKLGDEGERPLVIHHAPGTWTDRSPPLGAGSTGALLGVAGASGNDVWAVGWIVEHGVARPYLVHWNGAGWTRRAPGGHLGSGEAVLTDVAMQGRREAWAVGYQVRNGNYRPLVQHWNGNRWSTVAGPGVASSLGILHGVSLDLAGRPTIVGSRWDASAGRWRGFAARREATGWGPASSPEDSDGSFFQDLDVGPHGDAWVVGALHDHSVALRWCPDVAQVGQLDARTASVGSVASVASVRSVGSLRSRVAGAPSGTVIVARDVTADAGLAQTTFTYHATSADFDGNGWPDIFISRHAGAGWLLLNNVSGSQPGTFTEAPDQVFPGRDRHGCTSGDADGDGRADLYCANGALRGAGLKSNELWLQTSAGAFTESAVPWRAADPLGRGRLTAFFDLDHDPYADLFVANRPPRTDGMPSRHLLLADPSGHRFVRRSVAGFDAGTGADCLRAADLNGDGWQDILICQHALGRPNGRGTGLRILRNEQGSLKDVTANSGITRRDDVDAVVADMNGDGRQDIVELTTTSLRVDIQRNGRFVPGKTIPVKQGASLASGDVDGDGDLDLYVQQGVGASQVPDSVLLNSGAGTTFAAFPVPSATTGSADAVVAIDHDLNGLMDFLVLNGSNKPGPVQLIAFFPMTATAPAALAILPPQRPLP